MGNSHGHHSRTFSRQSTSSDQSSSCPHMQRSSSVRLPACRLPSTHSSSDSEPNNNHNHTNYNSISCSVAVSLLMGIRELQMPQSSDLDVLQVAQHIVAPVKQRKISRAASVGRTRSKRGFSRFSKSHALRDGNRDCVQQTWSMMLAQMGGISEVGLGIYQRIFESAPELKAAFGIPDTVQDVHTYPAFHRSGKLFASVIDLCVRSIDSLDAEMGQILVMYGRRHYHRQEQGFRIEYMPLFENCMIEFIIESLPEEEKTLESISAWNSLIKYICSKLSEGFQLERIRAAHIRRKSTL